jgi:hypothetical protein
LREGLAALAPVAYGLARDAKQTSHLRQTEKLRSIFVRHWALSLVCTLARRHARSACSQRRRLPDPDHEAFVEWFVAYWRRRGSDLFADPSVTKEASTHA